MDNELRLTHHQRIMKILILLKLKDEALRNLALEEVFDRDLFSEDERDFILFNINDLDEAMGKLIAWAKNNNCPFDIDIA